MGANGATFTNKLRSSVGITVNKVWNCDTGNIPDSITVNLLRNGAVYQTATLSAANNWTYTWTGLSVKNGSTVYNYEVQEVVPDGFTASYTYTSTSGSTEVTITNTIQTFGLDITKVNEAGDLLEGAVFNVLNANGETLKFIKDVSGAYVMDKSRLALPDLTTDAKGKLVITGLPAGTYTLREIKAPNGYGLAEDRIITLGTNTEGLDQNGILAVTVVDREAVYELPETGGIGQIPYTAGGLLLMTAAGLTLLYNHKKRGKEDPASS